MCHLALTASIREKQSNTAAYSQQTAWNDKHLSSNCQFSEQRMLRCQWWPLEKPDTHLWFFTAVAIRLSRLSNFHIFTWIVALDLPPKKKKHTTTYSMQSNLCFILFLLAISLLCGSERKQPETDRGYDNGMEDLWRDRLMKWDRQREKCGGMERKTSLQREDYPTGFAIRAQESRAELRGGSWLDEIEPRQKVSALLLPWYSSSIILLSLLCPFLHLLSAD